LETAVSAQRRAGAELLAQQERLLQKLGRQRQERQMVAYDIHDGLAQQITGALYHFQARRSRAQAGAAATPPDDFSTGLRLLEQAAEEARFLVNKLRSVVTDSGDLLASIQSDILDDGKNGTRVELEADADLMADIEAESISAPVKIAIFRIVQEAVNNARRHSRADKISVSLARACDRIAIRVADRGLGFEPTKIADSCAGLEGIHERAQLLGGRAAIVSSPGNGTTVNVDIPLSLCEDRCEVMS
jgi:signal transduction histidine kinase